MHPGASEENSNQIIRLHPEPGHPSSLWPSESLVSIHVSQPYILPSQIGIGEEYERRILSWTDTFHKFFKEDATDFNSRPSWSPGLNIFDWYDEGYQIVSELRSHFPDVQVRPEFAQYFFSINGRRENLGLLPISALGTCPPGHISISDVRKNSSAFH